MSQELIEAITEMREEDAVEITKQLLDSGTRPVASPGCLPRGDGHHRQAFRNRGLLHPGADPGRGNPQPDFGHRQAAHAAGG